MVTARGNLAFDAALGLLKQVFDTAKEKEVNKILVNCLGLNGKLSTYERYNLGAELATYLRQGGIEPRLAFVGKPPTVDGFGVRVGQKSRRNHRGVFEPARSGELACNLATLSHLRAFGTRANTRHKSAPTREKQPGQAHQQGRWVPTKLYHPNLLSPFTIIVELFGTPVAIHLIVSDPGVGFDPKVAMKGSGFGRTSMRDRLKLMNGAFSIDSQPKRGTKIHASVPLRE